MSELHQRTVPATAAAGASFDAGLRAHMLGVYNLMAIGLGITGFVAWAVYSMATTTVDTGHPIAGNLFLTEFGRLVYGGPIGWIAMLAPFAIIVFMSVKIDGMKVARARRLFWTFSLLMGVSLSTVFLVYTAESITQVFFVTAASFGALSLYGYTTRRDLSGLGTFLFMGLIGLVLALVVNLFLQSSAMGFALSVIGVLVFAGLTASDTQAIKEAYDGSRGSEAAGRASMLSALSLYLNFLNLFTFMLNLIGIRTGD